jgi:hypothetical protein
VTTRFILVWLVLMGSAAYALDEEQQRMSESNLIARHQRCVLSAYAQNAKTARDFDPDLLEKSIAQCEMLLVPLRRSIIARTYDPNFAESILEKIRRASKRGVAVALLGYISREK